MFGDGGNYLFRQTADTTVIIAVDAINCRGNHSLLIEKLIVSNCNCIFFCNIV